MHPFAGSVTVTAYGPGAVTDFVLVVTPPPQLNVAEGVLDDAVSVTVVTAHVRGAGAAMLTLGVVIF